MLILNKLLMSARHCAHALLKLLKMFHKAFYDISVQSWMKSLR